MTDELHEQKYLPNAHSKEDACLNELNLVELKDDSNYPCKEILKKNFELINDQILINIKLIKLIGSGGFGKVGFQFN